MNSRAETQSLVTARWSNVAVMNFVVDPALLRGYMPGGVELATFRDQHLLSLVGFQFQDTRLGRVPVPFYGDFIELFLGFFVQRRVGDQHRRGWIFIRKIVPGTMVALVGRMLYKEDYIKRPMRAITEGRDDTPDRAPHVRYEWNNAGRWNSLDIRCADPTPNLLREGTIEHYVTENYGGFARRKDGRGIEFPAEHTPWLVWPAAEARLDCDVEALYGAQFAETLRAAPHSAFLASGSAVTLGKASTF